MADGSPRSDLADQLKLITSIRGIANPSGMEILGELGCLPKDLTAKQLVAQAGLDPRPRQSGTVDGPRRISRAGSKYLRAAMHMPAVCGVQHCPEIAAFYLILTEQRRKKPLVAYTAIARKLLRVIHGILQSKTRFDAARFYQPKMLRAD